MFTAATINQKDKITQIPSKRNMKKKKNAKFKKITIEQKQVPERSDSGKK